MRYYAYLDALGMRLLALFERGLDLAPGTFDAYFTKNMNSLRLLHYPPQRPDDPAEYLGARAHTDTNAFTMLVQDANGGLEIRNRDGDWVAVPPVPDTFVVNVGEVLKVWTDGIFSSTVHRVINRSGRERYSIPFFMYPSYDAMIQPLLRNPDPGNVAPENLHTSMPRDRPFVYGDFKARSTANIMPGKVTVPPQR
jgi:isopenicillin N synthase-like dioxygenase